jgi:hypothetical protein
VKLIRERDNVGETLSSTNPAPEHFAYFPQHLTPRH